MTRTLLEFFPAVGDESLEFSTGSAAPLRLINLDGVGPVPTAPQSIKSPGQTGETAVDVIAPPRTVVVQSLLQAADRTALWALRAALARALVVQPVRLGETLALGTLRLTLPDRDPLELLVIPQSVDLPLPKGYQPLGTADIEFFAEYPYWQEVADTLLYFTTDAGGFEWGVEFPLDVTSNNVEQEVINAGDVDAFPLFRIYGECDTVRMLNETTDETIEVGISLTSDEYLEIDTAFGRKSITKVTISTGATANVMADLNLDLSDFWTLRPGLNLVKFEADTNTSGHAELHWRQRFSGV